MRFTRLAIVCVTISCFAPFTAPPLAAQTSPPSPFQQLLGTWEWRAGPETFRLILLREPAFKMPDGTAYSVILGRHRYVRNGVVVEQSFTKAGQDGNPGFTLFGFPRDYNTFYMSFWDMGKEKLGRSTLKLEPSNSNELHWHLTEPTESVGINRTIPRGFSVPTDIVLKRVD